MTEDVYNAVKRRVEVLLTDREKPPIELHSVDREEQDEAGRLLAGTAAAHRQRLEEVGRTLFPARGDSQCPQGGPAVGWSPADLEDHFLASLLDRGAGDPTVSGVIAHLGHGFPSTVDIHPPYAFQRTEGNGILDDALNTGMCLTLPSDNGLSLAGVGFKVFPSADRTARITPQGSYKFNMFCLGGSPGLRSQGGLGAAVYVDANPSPVVERQAMLWNLVGVPQFFGQVGSGLISDAASPGVPGTFGTVPLSPLEVQFRVGHVYVVWYWAWQQRNAGVDDGFFAGLTMTFQGAHIEFFPPFVGPG
jgi:hypothetical protein